MSESIKVCTSPREPACRDGANHVWERSLEQKTIGGLLGRHENQQCSRCGDKRCIWARGQEER